MPFEISIALDNPDPSECPTTLQELTDSMNARLHGTLEGNFIPYVTGAATPGTDDQDKIWHRTDAQGRPVGTFVYYHGTWRKQYSVPIGTIAMYSGNPAVDFAASGHAGTISGEWDGWQLCSGENGSPNLSDKFVVGAKLDDLATGYPTNGPWKTSVTGESTASGAGVHEITLTEATTWLKDRSAITLGHWYADGHTPNALAGLIGLSGGAADFDLLPAEGNQDPDPIATLPPYYALAFVIFQGYT